MSKLKRIIALLGSLALVIGFATPAVTASKYTVSQKTLSAFSSSATGLSAQQRLQVKQAVDANPTAEKFICTGIRFESAPMSQNITVRKRAKAACDYAKTLNPNLSTFFQNKPTKARSYAGKVLLTIKTPGDASTQTTVARLPYSYPACDTQANQPLTKKDLTQGRYPQTKSFDCATDRTRPTPAFQALVSNTNLEPCRIVDQSREGQESYGMRSGFPESPTALKNGTVKVLIAAFDFKDSQDPVDPVKLLKQDAQMFADYMDTFSRGNVKVEFEIHPTRIKLSEPAAKFKQSEAQQNTNQWGEANVSAVDFFYQQFIRDADDEINFSGYDIYLLIPPRGQDAFAEFNLWPPHSKTYATNEEPIVRAFTPGGDYHFRKENDLWFFWAHEIMHYYRIPDLYWHDQNSVKRTENTFGGAFKDLDIMDGRFVRTLNSYLMGIVGWANAGEQECLTKENFKDSSYEIFSVGNNDSSLKAVQIKLSDSELLVVESRRTTKFDRKGKRAHEGVLVYHVNTKIGNGEGPATVLAPKGRSPIWDEMIGGSGTELLDAFLYEGNSIDVAGYRIAVNAAYKESDVVSISKIPGWVPGTKPSYVCVTKDNRQMDDPKRVDCPLVF